MKVFQFVWKKLITPAGIIYTVLTLALLILMSLTDNIKPSINLAVATLFLLLSLMIAVCNLIFEVKSLSLMTRTFLHFFAVLLSLIVMATASTAIGTYSLHMNSLVLVLVYVVLYLIIVPPILLISIRVSRKQKEDKTYSSMFEQKK